jgi:NAD(P)H-dependent flavin oxidoreductase YrpB (nitropropane dioxygenase family)
LTNKKVLVVAAGGIFDGRGLAMALSIGCDGAWIGTRFVASEESGASQKHKEEILSAQFGETTRTLFMTGRPLRVKKKDSFLKFPRKEMEQLLQAGKIPFQVVDSRMRAAGDNDEAVRELNLHRRLLMGECSGALKKIESGKEIVESMVREAYELLENSKKMWLKSKLLYCFFFFNCCFFFLLVFK